MRWIPLLALLVGCDVRVLYTVEGTITSSTDGAPVAGIRVDCAVQGDPDSAGEGVSDDSGAYSCSAVLDGTTSGRGPRTVDVLFQDEDDAQNGAWAPLEDAVTVPPDASTTLDVVLDPA